MDPISAQLTQQAVSNLGGLDSAVKSQPQQSGLVNFDQSAFGKVLDTQIQSNDASTQKLLSFVENFQQESMGNSMKAIPGGEIKLDVAKAGEINGTSTKPQSVFDIFKEINSTQAGMDQVMESLSSGTKMSTMEMTRLQVLAHMNSVNMEVISKVGEMANRAIQTPFQMQVG